MMRPAKSHSEAARHLKAMDETAERIDALPKTKASTMLDRPEWAWLKAILRD